MPVTTTPAAKPIRPRWVWWLLALWLVYSLGLLAWHVLQNPGLYDICRAI